MAVAQVVFVLVTSTFVAWWRIDIYLLVALLLTFLLFALFTVQDHAKQPENTDDPDQLGLTSAAIHFVQRAVISFVLGAIWPSLPVIIWFGAMKDIVQRSTGTER